MENVLMTLYKIKWKHTANTYVLCHSWNKEKVLQEVEKTDGRCDDIVSIEEVLLPAFDGDNKRKNDFISVFTQFNIL